jgi:TonB-dependent receptor
MPSSRDKTVRSLKLALLGATVLGGLSSAAVYAQTAPAASSAAKDDSTVVVVTGYRASLQNATKAKKDSTNFTETIFAEDLGKFPDLNLAESMQRVPGMVVQRDPFTGDGTQISVRALPSSFTLVSMNGNRVAVASDFGFTGQSSPNRQVDLDMFPTGLFNKVEVAKTPSADTLEGGIAGTVNIQNARPFDRKGTHLVLALQDNYNNNSRQYSPRLTAVASKTWDKFGILAGFTSSERKILSDGFETVGWGDVNFKNFCGACDPGASFPSSGGFNTGQVVNPAGSNQFTFSNTVYPYSGNGLTAGPLTEAQLLALNPGVTEDQIKGALLPRLGRDYFLKGTARTKVGLVSMEYRPSEDLRFTLDILGGGADRKAERSDMMWSVRNTGPGDDYNGGMIPLNLKVDSNDVVTSGTFANSNFFEESNFYRDKTAYGSVNGGMVWKLNDSIKVDAEAAYMRSTYERDVTFFKMRSPFQTTETVTYSNSAGNDMPTITPSVNLNDPNLGWRMFVSNIFFQRDKRTVEAKSFHSNIAQELGDWTLKAGVAYDDDWRHIDVYDNSTALRNAYTAAVSDATLPGFLKTMSTPLYRDGVSGAGFNTFVTPNFDKLAPAIGYDAVANAPGSVTTGTTYNGAGASHIEEKITAAYMMAYNRSTLFGVPVKSNFGLRWQTTDQAVTAPSSVNGQIVTIATERRYHDLLPSFNAVANVTDNLNLRFAASKTMTRANPSQMSSQLGFSDPSAQSASQGNPALKPFYSRNLDFGGEYYTSKTGYVGLTVFQKVITNYAINANQVVPFSALGIPFTSISGNQQCAMVITAGVNATCQQVQANPGTYAAAVANNAINLSEPLNLPIKVKLTGQEFMWVQPLDKLTQGLGYTFNYTHFDVSNVHVFTGVPAFTYNFTAFYENGPFSTHISYVDTGKMTIGTLPSPNSIPYDWFQEPRHQIDLSAAYKFKAFGFEQSLTLDATNLDNQGFRSYLGFKNVPYQFNNPGQTVILGWRASY